MPAAPMNKAAEFTLRDGIRQLIVIFLAWKLLLLAVACGSPGPGYDTSTQILFDQYAGRPKSFIGRTVEHVVVRLTRWDGVYFATSSARGHANEQEWAFSWTLAKITSFIARVLLSPLSLSLIVKNSLAGILISHGSHLLATIILYCLTVELIPCSPATKREIAFIAACLHILSPAGLFLSTPNGESAFAAFNFMGMLSYLLSVQAKSSIKRSHAHRRAFCTVAAGISFGLAAAIRSNGLLSGIIFAWDAIEAFMQPSHLIRDKTTAASFVATVAGGVAVAIGFASPQAVAYMEYCTGGNSRPWCSRIPPSIYSWVQDHYWGVGFLRYWTLNNLPLFILAVPMVAIMLFTGWVALTLAKFIASACASSDSVLPESPESKQNSDVFIHVLPRFALPQLVLAMLATTNFHVQIINRISSGYPVWYIVLAIAIASTQGSHQSGSRSSKAPRTTSAKARGINLQDGKDVTKPGIGSSRAFLYISSGHIQWIVRGSIMYAIVQGGLYASFLPPA